MAEISSFSVEEARQNCNIDWRAHKSCFDEQMAHFCMSEEMADVEFVLDCAGEITVWRFICYFYYHLPSTCQKKLKRELWNYEEMYYLGLFRA